LDDTLTVIISLLGVIGSAVISFLVAKFYGERWAELRRSRMEHSEKLMDGFFTPWLTMIGQHCKIEAQYSKIENKMIPFKPREPNDLEFYSEAMGHLKDYEEFFPSITFRKVVSGKKQL
jgi:hypothetical protein